MPAIGQSLSCDLHRPFVTVETSVNMECFLYSHTKLVLLSQLMSYQCIDPQGT